ncbi:MAG: adenylosuccinate synthase [Candidatus Micrarchaeota archaeon]
MKMGLAIIGSQFGDEGKGKIVDFLAGKADVVVRFNGGNNAGHTVKIGMKEYKLHLLPSGLFHPKKRNLIASNVVINPKILIGEIESLRKSGIPVSPKNLGIDYRSHLIMPWHILLEGGSNSQKIGTTGRGIGPCYEDKAARTGIRFEDLLDQNELANKIRLQYENKVRVMQTTSIIYPPDFNFASIYSEYLAYGKVLGSFACDVSSELHSLNSKNKSILFEGAQGTFLDNNFGTYPFLTSSNTTAPAAAVSCGVPNSFITQPEGVVKAYTTRVGNGILPTEISGELAEKIRSKGKEFGTTTGRARRIGWLDLPMLRTACKLNGFTGLHLTKLDVLAGLDEIKIATHYRLGKKLLPDFPANSHDLHKCVPAYRSFKGFKDEDWKAVAKKGKKMGLKALPSNAQTYVNFIQKELNVPLSSVSVGPEREEIIFLK